MTSESNDPKSRWGIGFDRLAEVQFRDGQSTVQIANFRRFRYQGDGAHEPNWTTETFRLDDVERVDFIVVPFSNHHLAHTMVSFGFAGGEFLTISVEARRRLGQAYSIVKGMLGVYPLAYVIGDERDCIGVRTESRRNTVHLYPSSATPKHARDFLISMLHRADTLHRSAEKYNSLFNNCLTNLRDHVNQVWPGRVRWSWKTVLTGHADYLAYELGLLREGESFESLNAKATINELATKFWNRQDFSKGIRSRWGDEVCAGR